MLDGELENDTLFGPITHTTDTHGFTEQLFGLCHLLGTAFMPRLKDLPADRVADRKMGGSEEPPKFREETSKKQRQALHDRSGHTDFAVAHKSCRCARVPCTSGKPA